MLGEANRKIKQLDPMDQSLQKAEVALADGDLRTAARHATAVERSATASPDQVSQAAALGQQVDRRRHELEATVPDALVQAERDYMAGRYGEAKAGLEMVYGSGVTLTQAQQATLDKYQLKLVDLSGEHPELFGAAGSAGMMQPGTVKRREEQPPAQPATPPSSPAAQPTAQPSTPPPAVEPLPPPPSQPPTGEDPTKLAMRTEASSLLAEADRAFDEKRWGTARATYERLAREFNQYLSPDQLQHVNQRIADAQSLMNRAQPPQPNQDNDRLIRKQQTIAIFNNDLGEATRAVSSGDTTRARDFVAQAQLALSSNRDVFAESEIEGMTGQLNDMKARIATEEQRIIRTTAEKQAQDLAKSQAEAERLARQERERRIIELIDRIRAYQSEQRYEEALQATDQLLFLDRNNPTGLLLHDTIFDIIIYKKANDIYNLKQQGYGQTSLDNQEASIPPANLVNYPPDWPAISVRRGGDATAMADTPENRRVLAELNNPTKKIPSVNFTDNSLGDVLAFVQSVTNQNIDVDWSSLEQANIQKDSTVSLSLTNVTPKTLLDRLVQKISGTDRSTRADWAVNDGVITVASEDKIRKNTTLVIYDVRDLLHEVPDYTDVPRIDLQQALQAAGSSGGGGGGGQSPFREEGNDRRQQQRDREQRMDDLISIITSNVDFDGWADNGGDTGKIQKLLTGGGGNLIITNTPKNHRAIAGLLSKLREIRAMQINVETRFLLVNQDFFERIGFDLDVYFNANNKQVRTLRGADPTIRASDFFGQDGRLGGVTGSATGALAPNASTTTPAGTALTRGIPAHSGWSPIGIQQDSLGLSSTIAPRSDWSDAILAASPALGIAGQFLDDVQVDFLIQATQADRRSIQLTAPRLTFTNGQTSNIYVATQTAFVSDLNPVVGDSAVGFDPTVGVVTEGVTLLVEGTVTADRRYVTMNVDAGVSRVDGFAQQPVTAVAGGQLVNSAATQSFIQLPKVTVTRVRTTVTVPDQGTILMGGQRLITEYEIETGVPVLSKLPIINRFFTNRIESKEEQTLLILIKPTILIQNEEEEKNYPGLLEQMRLGAGG
jgi:general secretion pathway protein D